MMDMTKVRRLTIEEEKRLAFRIADGDTKAKDFMVACNVGLVYHAVSRFSEYDIYRDEFISEGMFSLWRCVDRFDPSRNIKFSTFSYVCIKNSIKSEFNRIFSDRKKCRVYNVGVHVEDSASDYRDWRKRTIETEWLDEVQEYVDFPNIFRFIKPREARTIENRYLSQEAQPLTLGELAKEFGVTRERVRQIEMRAFEKVSRMVRREKRAKVGG